MTESTAAQRASKQADKDAIRPFQANFPETELAELRRRINATKWPERETVTDATQGVQLATMKNLARYWGTDYDWRKCEAKLNALPQFITEIDGVGIHFIPIRSKHENALPLIVTNGWPGSIIEQLKIVDPLTNPTAHGGNASDAFHVVIPSMPGYGYSGKPTTPGWDVPHIARAWVVLMKRLGYTKFVAQGGDWGAVITELMGVQAAPELLDIPTHLPRRTCRPHPGRCPQNHHDHLVDEHGDFRSPPLLGKQTPVFQCQRRFHPGCRKRLSGRDRSLPAQLGGAGVSQTDPLQQARQRWTLCCVGTTATPFRRGARGLQIAAVVRAEWRRVRRARRLPI